MPGDAQPCPSPALPESVWVSVNLSLCPGAHVGVRVSVYVYGPISVYPCIHLFLYPCVHVLAPPQGSDQCTDQCSQWITGVIYCLKSDIIMVSP